MAHALLFPSVLGVRKGVTDIADALTDAGHEVTTVDPFDGETFDDYPTGMARTREVGDDALYAQAEAAAKGVGGPFVTVGFSVGGATAQWLAGQHPERARGVVMVGGGVPMRFLETSWPPGVPGQVHVTAGDPFHEEDREFDDEVRADVEDAGGAYAFVEYPGEGHVFNDPTLAEYQPEEARLLTRHIVEFVDQLDAAGEEPAG